ncbi:MAG: hypothetical protein GTO63_36765 [Anaerolineae bacterium]|nr:hypothetical protein [Anaerolineae bacterium]NIO00307.1 hypothetical protein [Anaerolineae bacterium]NIQ83085.1 hypothetical protein [Anaerolineae bacterium]
MNPFPAQKRPEIILTLLAAIVVLGMALRLYDLDGDSLWFDQIKVVLTARLDFVSILRSQEQSSVHPPLLYMLTRILFLLFRESGFVARLPAAMLGSFSILLAYKVGESLWTRKEGLIGALLLAVNAYDVRYSQEARDYALMVFLALPSLIVLLKALRGNKKGLWIGFVLCTALSLYNHYFAFLFLPAEVLFGVWVIAGQWL